MIIEQILDNAIKRVRSGEEISTVVSSYPAEVQSELSAMIQIMAVIASLPRKNVPVTNHRKLFLQYSPQPLGFASFIKKFKLLPTTFASFLVVSALTAFGAQASLPGDKLFSVKKSYESLEVKLATNPQKRTDLQLKLASQRFEDAQKVLASGSDADKKVALVELNQQTTVALSDLKDNAVSLSAKDPSIVQKAVNLTSSQTNLISKVDPKIADSGVVKDSAQSTTALHDIQKIIATANEESNATVVPNPTISTTGLISNIKDNTITIEKNIFLLNDKTLISNKAGNAIKLADLSVDDRITIEANIEQDKNMAKTITLISSAKAERAAIPILKPKEVKYTEVKKKVNTETNTNITNTSTAPEELIANPSNDTFGGFIAEPPIALPVAK
ncbi:MAG: hypothetical protein NVSMB66_5160 [Candidatus Doudnabacteria bacterium]